MTAKKSIALLIALAMAVAMLAGCSSGTPTDANDPASAGDGSAAATGDERTPATFSLLQMAAATSTVDPWIDTPVGQYLQEKTNVELEIEFLVGSDVRQKASLLIAAGEYPDLLTTSDASATSRRRARLFRSTTTSPTPPTSRTATPSRRSSS